MLPLLMHGRIHMSSASSARSTDAQELKYLVTLIDNLRKEKLLLPFKCGVSCGS